MRLRHPPLRCDSARNRGTASRSTHRITGIIGAPPKKISFRFVRIGGYVLPNNLAVAPMAGVTDRPFRMLCKRTGAGYAVSEMVAANPRLRDTQKSRQRIDHTGEPAPIAVQIAGADPAWMADAARYNVERGAEIVDINMGCPAKKVCNNAAGSALLANESLALRIIDAVVNAVDVPVTLKIRTGPSPANRNAVNIARRAEDAGIVALAVHGRTRACMFVGPVEYETVRAVKDAVSIPVIANGDIASPRRAHDVLQRTGVDGLMIGRPAQGNPWIFREIHYFLTTGEELPPPTVEEARDVILAHLDDHYGFHGEAVGVRTARKHLHWYTERLAGAAAFRPLINAAESAEAQRSVVRQLFARLAERGDRLQRQGHQDDIEVLEGGAPARNARVGVAIREEAVAA